MFLQARFFEHLSEHLFDSPLRQPGSVSVEKEGTGGVLPRSCVKILGDGIASGLIEEDDSFFTSFSDDSHSSSMEIEISDV